MSSLEVTTVDVLDSITVNNSVNAVSVSATTVTGNVVAQTVSATTVTGNVVAQTVSATTVTGNVVAQTVSATTVTANVVAQTVNATSVSATTLSGNGASITSVTPADGTVTEAKLSNGAVTASKTASTIAKYADTTANFTGELQYGGVEVGYRNIPFAGYITSSHTLTTSDIGKHISIGAGGSIVIPNSVFSAGDVIVIVNAHNTSDITITCNITYAFIAGDNTNKGGGGTMTLAGRGIANVLFVDGLYCIISGNVS